MPNLAELRLRVASALETSPAEKPARGQRLREIVADVQTLHADAANAGALFQAASQFNLLEMASPEVTPEAGVGIYQNDRTQGPACATAAAAGTVYRSYFVPLGDRRGQSSDRQVDCLADMGRLLDNTAERLWSMRNGYALPTGQGLVEIGQRLATASDEDRDRLRQSLRIGLHWDVEVTLPGAGHRVTQVYGSALPLAYGGGAPDLWEPFARLILEASYEATLCAAVLNAIRGHSDKVFLTLLGGGVFGNEDAWIFDAIERALRCTSSVDLDLAIVSYGRHQPSVTAFLSRYRSRLPPR